MCFSLLDRNFCLVCACLFGLARNTAFVLSWHFAVRHHPRPVPPPTQGMIGHSSARLRKCISIRHGRKTPCCSIRNAILTGLMDVRITPPLPPLWHDLPSVLMYHDSFHIQSQLHGLSDMDV
ncbi:uncharacterized protein EI90DRAFT_3058485 [Cantharellus anzutake]|uniref:uncharacterized protein n=1 Tax=Cantharellus anzutake TaxID=1750568 RepID=UPI00190372D6|nr:uncharacterized protein EI90DRAFT_3058485 [Cantharellus anzutake]KAF8331079.1 hypothetical protein EI90DRAFT_3058485 [Cantharellus anzutake]